MSELYDRILNNEIKMKVQSAPRALRALRNAALQVLRFCHLLA